MSIRIALAGNPNSGKTSLFNQLTGAMQKVGNWGGVTVDIKKGFTSIDSEKVAIIDLPGTYSLCAYSLEERVARDYIIEENPDVVIDVIDATNLERHLYLTVQMMEMGVRPVLALNMWDEVLSKGVSIDIERLSALLGLAIVPTTATTGKGIDTLLREAVKQTRQNPSSLENFRVTLPEELESAVLKLGLKIRETGIEKYPSEWLALKLFEHDNQIERFIHEHDKGKTIISDRNEAEKHLERVLGEDSESLIAEARYGFISGALHETVKQTKINRVEISDRIDTVLTHRFWAYPIFIMFMWLLFQATFKLGEYPMSWIEMLFDWLHGFVIITMDESPFRDLLAEGVIAGVGGVAVFLPNILILFLGISIMEDTGYMARAAFITDKLMHHVGLHGKSFIPMIMGLGCSVPAIMAARTLESEKDRIKTILLTPLIACSARLPVFVLFAGSLFPRHAGNIVFLFQVIFSFGAFLFMGLVFKHTLFRKTEDYPFVMELPPYRIPTARSVVIHMWHKAEHYLKKMGGVVLVFSVILWWAVEYPKAPQIEQQFENRIESIKTASELSQNKKATLIDSLKAEKLSATLKHSYIGKVGTLFEPMVRTFGTDWRGAISLISGFVAKEVVVGSMGVLYAAGEEQTEKSTVLREKLREHFSRLSAFAFMLFVLLYTPCVVALVTVVHELRSFKWSIFSIGYQVAFAWICATIVYQAGKFLGLG
ncbi:MAG: ferrous iron transport protein B [Chitinivibrionales bacterium]|nr:ferrous iron transport protein B [Chitinivibrionales bacterium]